MPYRRYSRMARKEEARNLYRAAFFTIFTIGVVIFLALFGLQVLTKLAVFLGNLKSSSTLVEKDDAIPPTPPVLEAPLEATRSALIQIKGFAEANSKVEIFVNDVSHSDVVADNTGSFSLSNILLDKGKNEIHAKATDDAGNVSQASKKVYITLDNEAPPLTVSQPQDKAKFFWPEEKATIVGQTEPGVSVTINGHFIVLSSEGKFSYPLRLSQGDNLITIAATDKAGNKTETSLTVHYSL